jgi:hypothetical protein
MRGKLISAYFHAVVSNWKGYVTGSILTAVLWTVQGIGWLAPHPWVYGSLAIFGLLFSIYQAWASERLRVEDLAKQLDETKATRKRELIRIVSVLRRFQDAIIYWRGVTSGNYSNAVQPVTIVPQDLSTTLYEAQEIKPEFRSIIEEVAGKATEAERLIAVYLSQPTMFIDDRRMKQAYTLLDHAAPKLDTVIAEIDSFEKGMTK